MLIDNSSLPGIFLRMVMPSSAWLTPSVSTALRCVLNGARSLAGGEGPLGLAPWSDFSHHSFSCSSENNTS